MNMEQMKTIIGNMDEKQRDFFLSCKKLNIIVNILKRDLQWLNFFTMGENIYSKYLLRIFLQGIYILRIFIWNHCKQYLPHGIIVGNIFIVDI